jgi:tetratricopeptide (TPR) repeat protein
LLLTERLGPRIEALKQKLSAEPQEGDWRRLAMFLRAKGDFSAAADAAAETSDVVFAAKVLAEAARFSQAGKLAEEFPKGATTWPDAPAFAAAWYELAGDEAGYGRVMQGLRQAVGLDKQPARPQAPVPADPFSQPTTSTPLNQAWRLAETLLIAERVELALEVLKKTHPVQAHALLVRQHRHSEALAYATVTADKVLDRQWFDSLPGGLGEAQQQAAVRFSLAAQVARELRDLGRPAQVEQVVETLRGLAAAESQKGARWSALAALAWRLERYDDAFSNAEQALAANQSPASVFAPLLSKAGPLAAAWFSEAINRDPLTDRKAAIAQAVWLVVAQPPAGKLPANWRELVLQAAEQARKFPPAERGAKLMLPADICRLRGELALARKLYEEAGESFPAAALKAADVAALENDWTAAASIYGKLSAANNSDALALLLHGHALEKSGQAEEGAKKMRLASLTALAPDVRYTLATGLQERGLEELAAEQFELVRRTALPDSVISVNAAQRVGNLVHQKEPARATDCWRQLHLHILNSSSIFLESEGYLSLPQIMHKVRARAALAAGQRDVLQAELDRCEKLLPGDVRLVVELVPKLDAAGLADVSEKLLQRGLAAHQLVLEEFPDSPSYLNNAAWITARAQRRLDEGLALIERALKIAPDEASYHDTLAEIQFQRGDRDAAVAAAKKAVELSPHSKLFAARLKHFQEDAVKTLDTVNE